jgi:hypothetical protein
MSKHTERTRRIRTLQLHVHQPIAQAGSTQCERAGESMIALHAHTLTTRIATRIAAFSQHIERVIVL